MTAKQLRSSWFVQFEFKEILFYFVLKWIQRKQYFGLSRKDFLLETVIALIIYKSSHGKRSRACLDILGQLVWRQGICCLAGGEGSESLGGFWGVRRGVRFLGTQGLGNIFFKVGMCSYKHRWIGMKVNIHTSKLNWWYIGRKPLCLPTSIPGSGTRHEKV